MACLSQGGKKHWTGEETEISCYCQEIRLVRSSSDELGFSWICVLLPLSPDGTNASIRKCLPHLFPFYTHKSSRIHLESHLLRLPGPRD